MQNKRNDKMMINTIKGIIVFIALCSTLLLSQDLLSQNFEFTLYPRRAFDQIHIELWARALDVNAPRLGNATLVLQYNTTFLTPSPIQNLTQTDTLLAIDANSIAPVIQINTEYSSANGYVSLTSGSYSTGFYALEINQQELGVLGLQPSTIGSGSFLGILSFDIIGNPSDSALANIAWSKSAFPGDIRVFDADGNDIETTITFTDPSPNFRVLGITLLSPNRDRSVIDRDANYKLLSVEKDYADAGYPIYFERSINPEKYHTVSASNKLVDTNLAYLLEYSLDNGTTWVEFGRVAETDKTATVAKGSLSSGEIFSPKGAAYSITTQSGGQINATTFRQPLRIIWSKDPYFLYRTEEGKVRITELSETATTPITSRTPSNINAVSTGQLIIGRLFFVQLNGVNQYLKSTDAYSNATQLTVAAWVNLNSYQNAGSITGIVASSGGPNATATYGSNEGAWMLYLRDGRIPAFRAREILNRGNATTPNYLAVVEAYSMDSLRAVNNNPLTTAHANNWVHIAATVADGTVSLYINGELVQQAINNNAPDIRMMTTVHPIWVGVNPNTAIAAGSFLNAGVKGVQIWRTALTQDQIRTFASGVTNPEVFTTFDDIRKGLEMYWTFEGTTADLASHIDQKGRQDIAFYDDGMVGQVNAIPTKRNNNLDKDNKNTPTLQDGSKSKNGNSLQASLAVGAVYRPDQPHLQLSSPATGAGIMNKPNDNTEIRWVTYGLSDLTKLTNKLNFEIEYTIDGGKTWTYAKNPAGQNLSGTVINNTDIGYAIWQPYQNNSAAANLRSVYPFAKTVQLRLKGLDGDGNVAFLSLSDTFTIAPYFALQTDVGSQLRVVEKKGMNITKDYAYIEVWIKPYRFPNAIEAFFPIVQKSDAATGIHYSLRLMSDGTLSFIVTNTVGTILTARTTTDFALVAPNSVQNDTAWTHVAVLFIKSNGNNVSEARFYIDGNVQGGNDVAQQFDQLIQLNTQNEYPLYIASNPSLTANSFVGELKEIRFWDNLPNNYSAAGAEPTEFTKFVQKSQSEVIDDLMNMYKNNLHSYFSMEGGSFFANGGNRVVAVSDINGAILNNFGTPVKFVPFMPFVKLVEPKFRQAISNSDSNVKVRWVGLYYDGLNFTAGAAKVAPSLEYSLLGGGGNVSQPYQYIGSSYWAGNKINSIKLLKTTDYLSGLTANQKYFALALNASMANPDANKDGVYTDQGALSPTLTNARLRLAGSYTVNGEKFPLLSEGPLFTINPLSNFTARIMLEGYHQGNQAGKIINQLGASYNQGGLRIRLYTDNSGEVGNKVGPDAESKNGYTDRDPNDINKAKNNFGNVDFVFTEISNGSYWLLVDHINHLPVMSRYPAPFLFTGDIPTTWAIESGWDFTSWNGVDDNVMPSPFVNPWESRYYSARGTAINTSASDPDRYSTTGLIFNGGNTANNGLSAMVGGDVNQDDMINAADRVIVRQDAGLQSYQSDITGDKYVNASDRTITDKNFGKVSSLLNLAIPAGIVSLDINPFVVVSEYNIPLSEYFNYMAKVVNYKYNDNPNDKNINDTNNAIFELGVKTKLNKQENQFQAISYRISAIPIYNDSGYVDLRMYIRNIGEDFALANCTFAVSFDPEALQYMNLRGDDSVMFNSAFDYNNLNNQIPENGYLKLSSAPKNDNAPIAYDNIRTIEIDYDAFANIGGINVPFSNTYLGTLRFKVSNNAGVVAFHWHESKAVYTTKGHNATDEGQWDSIPAVLLYKATILQPNGGEEYSVMNHQTIKWTATGKANIYLEFSANDGYNWQTLNDTLISTELLSYGWTTPFINSDRCLIRLVDAETRTEIDRSDATFSIITPWGNIYKPYANPEPYIGGKQTTIEWAAGGTSCVKFEFSSDGGVIWSSITGTYNAATGKANWTVPRITTKTALIRMIDCESGILLSTSGVFAILTGSINFTAPMQNQVLKCSANFKIRWTRQVVTEFDMQLSIDGGKTWELIESNIDATALNYMWVVPDINTDSAIIRALYMNDPMMEFGRSKIFKIRSCTSIYEDFDVNIISNIFPSPVNQKAYINFNLERPILANIKLVYISGSEVMDIVSDYYIGLGNQPFEFDLSDIPSGNYYVFIQSVDFNVIRELLIVR